MSSSTTTTTATHVNGGGRGGGRGYLSGEPLSGAPLAKFVAPLPIPSRAKRPSFQKSRPSRVQAPNSIPAPSSPAPSPPAPSPTTSHTLFKTPIIIPFVAKSTNTLERNVNVCTATPPSPCPPVAKPPTTPKNVRTAPRTSVKRSFSSRYMEKREAARAKKQAKKRDKEQAKLEKKQKRAKKRLERHYLKLGLPIGNVDAVMNAAPTDPRFYQLVPTIDLSILPVGDKIVLKKPLPFPFDCVSFDGKFMLSVLAMTDRRDIPTICRFIRAPIDDVDVLMGPIGAKNPQEAYLFPSLGAAARRAYVKSTAGWSTWFVLVMHEKRMYRVPLDRFRTSRKGPGFIPRPGLEWSEQEITDMCELAAKSHPSTNEFTAKRFFSGIHNMGSHSDRDVVPEFFEPFLRVMPTIVNPTPTESTPYGEYILPPFSPNFMPTFCHTSS